MVKENQERELDKKRLELAKRVFREKEDQERYGFSQRAIDYMRLSVSSYRKSLTIQNGFLTEEEDFIKVDDTWLKLSKIFMDALRYDF